MIGKTVSHYRILEKIGEGGMGVIYKAEDLRLDRTVALKFLSPSDSYEPAVKARFIQEAKAASALDHPNICTIFEIAESLDGEIFIAMAYYEGRNLEEVIKSGDLDRDNSLEIMGQIADGLAQVHQRGIIHQDINPRNIIVLDDGQVKIVDFGVAKLTGKSHLTSGKSTMGTLAYMAPEQIQSKPIEPATDVWSLGALFYEMLAGRKAFDADHPQAVMYAIVNVDPEPLPGLPEQIRTLLDKALQKKPQLRHKDAGQFLEELEVAAGLVASPAARPGIFLPRRVWLSLSLLLLVVVVLGVRWLGSFRQVDFERKDLLLITEFENRTGEEVFDGIVSQALAYDLGQSPHVSLFAGRRLTDALERMEKKPGVTIDGTLGRELAEREGLAVVLEGAISKIDNTYSIGASLVNPVTGEMVTTHSVQAGDREELFPAIDRLARNIRKDLGESLLSIDSRDKPLARVTTGSLQALRFYTQAEAYLRKADWEKATTFYREAIAADSTFAIAYSKLGRIYFITARTGDALAYSGRAMDHRARLSDREKFYIEAEYYRYRADYDQAIEKFILLLDEHEYDYDVRMNLATTYMLGSRFDSALTELEAAAAMAPDNWYMHFALGNAYGGLGRYEEAREQFTRVLFNKPRQIRTLDNLSWIHVCMGDLDTGRALQDSLLGGPDRPSVSPDYRLAKFHYYLGELREAGEHLQKALGEVRRSGNVSMEAWILIYRGLAHLQAGRLDRARADLEAALDIWPGAAPRFLLGDVLARRGEFQGAVRILATLESGDDGEVTHEDRGYAHRLRGTILYYQGDFKAAAGEFEMSLKILPQNGPRLMLARSYIETGEFNKACEALQPAIDFPFVSYLQNDADSWPRALALRGEIADRQNQESVALEYFRQAHAIWVDADEDHQDMRRVRIRLGDMNLKDSLDQ